MAVGLTSPSDLRPVPGILVGTACALGRYGDRDDLAVLDVGEGCHCAAVFTRNAFVAAPVTIARLHLAAASPRYLLINSGNANAGNGEPGLDDAVACCEALAKRAGIPAQAVLPFSTGVIGERLPVAAVTAGIDRALEKMIPDGWLAAAQAIMTTDTVPKGVSRRVEHPDGEYVITGIAKGAGMIRPDMATMLAFLGTDAPVAPAVLQRCFAQAASESFNRITVDGDTSTNDACVMIATGQAAGPVLGSLEGDPYRLFSAAVTEVCSILAQSVVRDAEGATKFITVNIKGGHTEADCLAAAYAVAQSPLVKTAFFAGDPNWGRIMAAVGRCGIPDLDMERTSLDIGDVRVCARGARAPAYREADGLRVMNEPEIDVTVDLGRGSHRTTVWTSDLSHEYVRINAEYRT